jgi:hypothetical protein
VVAAPTTWVALNGDGCLETFVIAMSFDAQENYIWQLYQVAPSEGWSQWVDHGAPPPQPSSFNGPVVAPNSDGRLELFFSNEGVLWHIWQTQLGGAWIDEWYCHNTPPGVGNVGAPFLARSFDGCLQVFVVGSDGALWQISQNTPSGTWSGWSSHGVPPNSGGLTLRPAVAASADGRLEVFAVGVDGALWHIWETSTANVWSGWLSHGTANGVKLHDLWGSPVVAANSEGCLELFSIGSDNAVWHLWQIAPNGGWTPTWLSHRTPPGVEFDYAIPALAADADGRLELFVPGQSPTSQTELWHINQLTPSGTWCDWYSHGSPPSPYPPGTTGVWGSPAVALNSDGRLELFIAAGNEALWHIWQKTPNGLWADWLSHQQPSGYVVMGQP